MINKTRGKGKMSEVRRGRCRKSDVGSRKSEGEDVGNRESEIGCWKLEIGGRKSEIRCRKSDVGNQKSSLALCQIMILLFGMFAISYAVGSEVGVVSGEDANTLENINKIPTFKPKKIINSYKSCNLAKNIGIYCTTIRAEYKKKGLDTPSPNIKLSEEDVNTYQLGRQTNIPNPGSTTNLVGKSSSLQYNFIPIGEKESVTAKYTNKVVNQKGINGLPEEGKGFAFFEKGSAGKGATNVATKNGEVYYLESNKWNKYKSADKIAYSKTSITNQKKVEIIKNIQGVTISRKEGLLSNEDIVEIDNKKIKWGDVSDKQKTEIMMSDKPINIVIVGKDGKKVVTSTKFEYVKSKKDGKIYETNSLTPEETRRLQTEGVTSATSEDFYEPVEWGLNDGIIGGLVNGAALGALAEGIINQYGIIGTEMSEEQRGVVGRGTSTGILAGMFSRGVVRQIWGKNTVAGGWVGFGVGVSVALKYIYDNYKDLDEEIVTFECVVWEAPTGGKNCQKCNNELLGCSEYQCKSLGKGCELLNPGSGEELCVWKNRNDDEPPKIEPWVDALDTDKYEYSPGDRISPPDRGVEIIPYDEKGNKGKSGDCIKAYTPLKFGVTLNEPATCKIDFTRKDSYEEMEFYMGSNSLARYNHSHTMSIPSIVTTSKTESETENTAEGTTITGNVIGDGTVAKLGEEMEMNVRCEDANGNSNLANFVFKFCIDKGKDYTAPLIKKTRIQNNQPVAFNVTNVSISLYTDEEADCKWNHFDKSYERMGNDMTDSERTIESAEVLWVRETNLTGIKDRVENDFYFRCNDTDGNVNKESYKLTLIGTQPLYIDWAKPNGTIIKDSVSPAKLTFEVKTSSGYQDGNAFCSYKDNDETGSQYTLFEYEPVGMTYQHTHDLSLEADDYDYSIRCFDAGGNADVENITFSVETDTDGPSIARAYKEEGYLKLITNEIGECVYNTINTAESPGCTYEFDDGIPMKTVSENEHFVEWNTQETFYIKCRDEFGTPTSNSNEYKECSITARPSDGETL